MNIFLSASVPVLGRGSFIDDCNPFLIQLSIRELVTTVMRDHKLIWGGHPAITPMIWAVCADLGVSYGEMVVLYQSKRYEPFFPKENRRFRNVREIDEVGNSDAESLREMRRRMLSDQDFGIGIFIAGMEGVLEEYQMFRELQPNATRVILTAPGGAAKRLKDACPEDGLDMVCDTVDFAGLFEDLFG